jgi:hypothetical protein
VFLQYDVENLLDKRLQGYTQGFSVMSTAANENPGCLTRILRFFNFGTPEEQGDSGGLPYRVRDDFLSPAELSFYH